MENMILKRLIASIVALSLATNGNISSASSSEKDTPLPKEGEEKSLGEEETEIEEEEEDINSKLIATLSDPSKQDRIEIKIIKRLWAIDPDGILGAVFNNVLLKCEEIRTPHKDPSSGLVHKVNVHGMKTQNIPVNEFKDSHPTVQSALGREISAVAWQLLENLYKSENQTMALNIIRELNVMQTEEEFGSYNILFKRINQIFFHSRRLLTVTIAPEIIKQYVLDSIGPTKHPTNFSFKTDGEEGQQKQQCKFTVDEDEYICEFLRKPVGVFFGSIVEIRTSDRHLLKRYYLKAHEGYPAVNKKNSKASYIDTTTQLRTSTDTPDKPTATLDKLDLRELFVYKVLEQLGHGPKVHFFINPYINYGLYIVTEDLNSEPNVFKELKDIGENVENADVVFNVNSERKIKQSVEAGLNELSVLTSIFQLKDIKGDNIGFVGTEETWDKLVHEEDNDDEEEEEENNEEQENQSLRPFIIDFLNETTDEAPTVDRDAQRYSLSQSLIDGEMFRSYSANAPYSSLIMPHEKLYTNVYSASKDSKSWSSNAATVYVQNARKLEQVTAEFLPKKQNAWHILNETSAGKTALKAHLLSAKDLIISTAEKVLQPTGTSSSVSSLPQQIQQLEKYCDLVETNYDITEELLAADESNTELCKLATEVHEMCESVQNKAKERPHTSKAKAKAKPKNTSVPKTQSGASAGLKQFIAEQRAKKEEYPQ
ncbi:MAG: hypothetical protein II796_01720 [Oscillospiraceae bacterium]|nr:hypothetical protein [Oscillospiraceae bacterium]